MNAFEQAGEAMMLAQEGNRQIAQAIAATFRRWTAEFKAWLSAMPTTLPPTESTGR
jgi:hypothetical protein